MTLRLRHTFLARLMIVLLVGASVAVLATPAAADDETITGSNTFASLDGLAGVDDDGSADGTLTITGNLTLDPGATITCNDSGVSGASACPITIDVSGDFSMGADSLILAENNNDGGSGGDITITVGGDMSMAAGSMISARKTSGAGDTGVGGDITITVGDINNATGNFFMAGGTTGYGSESGAKILTSGPGPAGDITITVGDTWTTEPGSVIEAGGPFQAQSTIAQGGKIYIVVGCVLTTEGRITSKGRDPGADLVHLEGCDVFVRGLVESTGKGHTVNANPNQNNVAPSNNCDGYDDGTADSIVRAGKPGNATACIEVWGGNIVIDGSGWAGELNADIGNGGASGSSWIDIYAFSSLLVHDGAGNNKVRDNNSGHTYLSTYAVHANTMDGSDNTPNTITAKVAEGTLTADPQAFESSAALNAETGHSPGPYFNGNGSTGGTIDLEASDKVDLDDAWINASGDYFGGASTACAPWGGGGTCGSGGHIIVHSWSNDIDWRDGSGDVRPNDTGSNGAGGTSTGGDITVDACVARDLSGTDFHGETVPANLGSCDGSKPTIPGYVVFNFDVWQACQGTTTTTTATTTTTTTDTVTTVTDTTTTTTTTDTTTTTTDTTTTTTTTDTTTTVSDTTSTTTTTDTTTTTTTTNTTTTTTDTTTTTTTTTDTTTTVPDTSTTTTTDTTTTTTPQTSTTTTGTSSTVPAPTPTPFDGAGADALAGGSSGPSMALLASLALVFGSASLLVLAVAPSLRSRRDGIRRSRPR